MCLKLARDRIAVLRDVVLRPEKTEDPALDPVTKGSLGRLLLGYIAEFQARATQAAQYHGTNQVALRLFATYVFPVRNKAPARIVVALISGASAEFPSLMLSASKKQHTPTRDCSSVRRIVFCLHWQTSRFRD